MTADADRLSVLANLQPVCGRKFFSKDDCIVSIHFTNRLLDCSPLHLPCYSTSPATPLPLLLHLPCCSTYSAITLPILSLLPIAQKRSLRSTFRALLPGLRSFSAPLKKFSIYWVAPFTDDRIFHSRIYYEKQNENSWLTWHNMKCLFTEVFRVNEIINISD